MGFYVIIAICVIELIFVGVTIWTFLPKQLKDFKEDGLGIIGLSIISLWLGIWVTTLPYMILFLFVLSEIC
jgi:hypothetical protein